MPRSTTDLKALEQAILEYLDRYGPTDCLTISADLARAPRVVQGVLWDLQDQGRTGYWRFSPLLHETLSH